MTEETMTTGEIVQASLTKIATVAAQQLQGMNFVIVVLHGDGYVQYTSSVDPLVAGAVLLDLGGSILMPNAKPDWLVFQNKLRIMNSIDFHELVDGGVLAADDGIGWASFTEHPYRWLMKADDEKAEKLWAIVERRAAGK